MAKRSPEDRFCFTWGLPNLGDMGFVPLYRFMLRAYAELGLTRQQMLCIIHLASYHYNSPSGESRPSLTTVATQMGYAHKHRVSELIAQLEQDGMLIVTRRPGFTSIYNASPFAKAAYDLWITQEAEGVTPQSNTPMGSVTPQSNTSTGSVTPQSNGVLLSSVTEEEEKEKEIGKEEEIILSETWKQATEFLLGSMSKATYNQHLVGSRLLPSENGTWRVQVRGPLSVVWVQARMSAQITRALAAVTGEEHELEVVGP